MFKDTGVGKIDGVGVGRLGGFEAGNNRYKWAEDKSPTPSAATGGGGADEGGSDVLGERESENKVVQDGGEEVY